MPMYTVTCQECDVRTVRMCKIDERDLQTCDECDAIMIRGIDKVGAVYAPTSSSGTLKV